MQEGLVSSMEKEMSASYWAGQSLLHAGAQRVLRCKQLLPVECLPGAIPKGSLPGVHLY